MKGIMQRTHNNLEFALPIEATRSQFSDIKWLIEPDDEGRQVQLLELAFSEQTNREKATLTLVQMLGRLKENCDWCPQFRLLLGDQTADEFLATIVVTVTADAPMLRPFVLDWIKELKQTAENRQHKSHQFLYLKPGSAYFGKLDIHDFFQKTVTPNEL
jgi:hypothetical protein